ncbi:hypothetical protein CEV31_1190 [Brucella thiophenivorans]|uniref:Uncharacterized protein n=1 Tax=Brucella thiophenivorans TaxID=571255 RepID=A0A256FY57_9HYPH|nr:hypothetical protein CEV31_1190 [Brucella thiophenivorans]
MSSFVLSLITFPFPSQLLPLYPSITQRDHIILNNAPVIHFSA